MCHCFWLLTAINTIILLISISEWLVTFGTIHNKTDLTIVNPRIEAIGYYWHNWVKDPGI